MRSDQLWMAVIVSARLMPGFCWRMKSTDARTVVDGEADEIRPEDVPVGDSVADRRARQEIIKQFYFYWKKRNPDLSRYNTFLKENIYINHTSLVETAGRASLTYLSTLAVLQLDAILQNARLCFVDKPKLENKQQSKFEKMLGMEYFCPGIGNVRLMVGVRRRDKTLLQGIQTSEDLHRHGPLKFAAD